MPSADEIIAKAESLIQRQQLRETLGRAQRSAAIRIRRVAMTCLAILVAAFAYGLFVGPLGIGGILAVGLTLFLAAILVVMLPTSKPVRVLDAAALPALPLVQLPSQTKVWLDSQRLALPAPARTLADGIGVKLAALGPQLQALDEREPAAAAIRRLVGDELPELVKGYAAVPEAMRKANIDGLVPERQLVDGLAVVDSELTRMSEQLARGDLEKLAVQGKYLELKYQGEV